MKAKARNARVFSGGIRSLCSFSSQMQELQGVMAKGVCLWGTHLRFPASYSVLSLLLRSP